MGIVIFLRLNTCQIYNLLYVFISITSCCWRIFIVCC